MQTSLVFKLQCKPRKVHMNADIISKEVILRPEKKSTAVLKFETELRRKIIGQDEAVAQLVDVYQITTAEMAAAGRPLANLLLLGPTGSGKTRLVEAAAEILFGDADAVIKIDCAEFQHSHEIAKLIGSPPGYIGHRETPPTLTQGRLNACHTDKLKLSMVLFDEIEKASDALWQLLLGILDKATLTLGDNRKVDFSRTIVFMTSNLGASEMSRITSGGIGFAPRPASESADIDRKIYRVAVDAAKRKFSPEFMNRIDKVIVFRTLAREHLRQILDIELERVQTRIFARDRESSFEFHCTEAAREFLLKHGTDPNYGARPLKRAIERYLVFPLSSLMSTGQVSLGDIVNVDIASDRQDLIFSKRERETTNGGGWHADDAETGYGAPCRAPASRSFLWRTAGR
jgi:ATP-dependent Clp protease ATP-binding subunit ClpB